MLTGISFSNYKSFAQGEINFKPITLLIGANSSGKSSLLQLLLLLKQSTNNQELYQSALKLNGRHVSLGEDENLIKDKNIKNRIELEFNFDIQQYKNEIRGLKGKVLKEGAELLLSTQALYHRFVATEIEEDNIFSQINRLNYNLFHVDPVAPIESEIFEKLSKYLNSLKTSSNFINYYKNSNGYLPINTGVLRRRGRLDAMELLEVDPQAFADTSELLKPLKSFKNRKAKIHYVLQYKNSSKKLEVVRQSVMMSNEKVLISLNVERDTLSLDSDILDKTILSKYSKQLNNVFYHDSLELKLKKTNNVLFKTVYQLFDFAYSRVEHFFAEGKINYVGPLRAHPQRYYLLDEANLNTSVNTQSGASLAEILKKNKLVSLAVNKWFKKFELGVSVEAFKDIIHNIKVSQNHLNLDITDVGFGISQVLPIVVQGFLSEEESLTIIEQPEIHLHPRMQADLADLFIDIVSNNNVCSRSLLIETHSEYILKRLRRRISEGTFKSEDLAIYFIHPRNLRNKRTAKIEEIKVSDCGSFDWPEDFYITEYEDDMAYFQNLAKKNIEKR